MARSRVVNLANFEQFTAINVLSDPGHLGGPVVIPNCIQVVLNWTLSDNKQGHNVLYGSVSGSFTPTATIADAILTGLTAGATWTALASQLHATSALASVTLRDVRSAQLPQVTSLGAAHAGTANVAQTPSEVAVVITERTALTGPANRGRIYIPGWDAGTVTAGNVLVATAVTALTNWAQVIPTVFTSQGLTLVIGQPARAAYTGTTGTLHPARAAKSQPVTSLVVRDNHFDSQRRRGLK
jgi:hypothetical protein